MDIIRGPNIAPLPRFEALPDKLEGVLLLTLEDNVTTDDILPAGAHILAKRSNIPAIAEFIFSKIDSAFAQRARQAGTGFILGGKNYGQGSSREHAALAPRYLGVRAVIVESFARIHRDNLANFGILPLELSAMEDREQLCQGDVLSFENLHDAVRKEKYIHVTIVNKNKTLQLNLDLSDRLRKMLLSGGRINSIKSRVF